MDQRVAIVGAGASGMLACKYTKERGFSPVVFEAEDCIGGIWNRTIKSTKLQTPKPTYEFFDFPWPSSVKEMFPSHTQVREYFESYARHFDLYRYIRFNSQVISIDYDGVSQEEMEFWDLWSGTSKAFSSKGKWLIEVQDTKTCSREVYKFEFVILCIGRFCGLPNIPEFPLNQGPEVFNGNVLHSMDYSAMDEESANKLIKGKRVTVIGSQKSAVDITVECADANGVEYPCTMIRRTDHWLPHTFQFWGVHLGYLYFNRFAELLVHKPGQSFLHTLLATLLSPLRWVISKFVETYLIWKLPLKKHGVIPEHRFSQDLSSCQIGLLPENFYDKVEEGSIILKKSQKFSFCKKGLIIDGETQPLETDVVILATGYNSDQKLSNIFKSHIFRKSKTGPPNYSISLYRQIIHPRIPQLAIIGYAGLTTLGASEIKCQWLVHFLDGTIELPSIREMEKDVALWEKHMKKYSGRYFWRGCNIIGIWYNDQICKDIGCESRRKKGFLAELFEPYSASNYAGLGRKK